jgi:hypothetical protein
MSESSIQLLTEKIKSLQQIIDDQMENLIKKELQLMQYKEMLAKETREEGSQTTASHSEKSLLDEMVSINRENLKLKKQMRTIESEKESKVALASKWKQVQTENEALMEMMSRQDYQTAKNTNVR